VTLEVDVGAFVSSFASSALARWRHLAPWDLTSQASALIIELLAHLPDADFPVSGQIAVHRTATVEPGATLKGPLIIGAGSFVAAGAYLRGGCWLAERCALGPGVELKSSFVFAGTTLAHFNFVGDSVVGAGVNLEAGSLVCNARNERGGGEIRVRLGDRLHAVPVTKFGALIGDGCRIGANAVIAPGALLAPDTIVPRASLHDQETPHRP
jgi:NDP-sugar pyrophosphorylase family protein